MHTFKNFKNFAEAKIDLSKPMTLLIGRNGSGKSNVIEGVELLAELLKGRDIEEISDVGRGGAFEIRGNLQGCFQQGKDTFTIGFEDKITFADKEQAIHYKITANLKPVLQISKQAMVDGKNLLDYLPTQQNSNPNAPANNDTLLLTGLIGGLGLLSSEDKGLNKLGIASLLLTAFVAVNQSAKPRVFTQHTPPEAPLLSQYVDTHVFDIYPRIIREYNPIGLRSLSRNGSNLSSVLYYLQQNSPEALDRILERIRQLPEEAFISFEFITTSDNSDVLFALKYPNGETISAKLLSDGTLRALAILTALETVPEGSRIIVEEIDNGVHASRVNVLVDAIWEASNRRHLNTLITTHNPATLDSLSDEQLECVVVCHYDKPSQSAKLTSFFELPDVDILMQKGKLGGLMTRNVIEHYLDPGFAQEQQKIASAWLASCQ